MNYRKTFLRFVREKRMDDFQRWIRSFPDLEQVDIMYQLRDVIQEISPDSDINSKKHIRDFEKEYRKLSGKNPGCTGCQP